MKTADQVKAYTAGKTSKRAQADAHHIAYGVWITLDALGMLDKDIGGMVSLMMQCGRTDTALQIMDRFIEANRR